MTPTPKAARGAFSTGWQREAGVSVGVGPEGFVGTDVFSQDPELSGFTHMV